MRTTTLYDQDLFAWTQHQIGLLQAQQWEQVDVENLIEELDSFGGAAGAILQEMSQFESPPLFKGGMLRQDFGVSAQSNAQQQKNKLAQAINRGKIPPVYAELPGFPRLKQVSKTDDVIEPATRFETGRTAGFDFGLKTFLIPICI
ncbi:MAG: DUF29 domain-containing protein [Aphanocapsa sp. GSE-SYN-MK-11-07L]|jgi:hypothetical protein|nr:DUF29 domain-containing protein [Aphanocapsa sp. GSE-SYN-MK-11-07L]